MQLSVKFNLVTEELIAKIFGLDSVPVPLISGCL